MPFAQQWVEGLTNWTSDVAFPPGSYQWTVQPWSDAGFGLKSDPAQFTVPVAIVGAPTAVTPTGILPGGVGITFTWTPVPGALWYFVAIRKDGATFASQYINNVNTWTPDFVFAAGDYQWTVQSWSPSGYGTAANPVAFTVPGLLPANNGTPQTTERTEAAPAVRVTLGEATDGYYAEVSAPTDTKAGEDTVVIADVTDIAQSLVAGENLVPETTSSVDNVSLEQVVSDPAQPSAEKGIAAAIARGIHFRDFLSGDSGPLVPESGAGGSSVQVSDAGATAFSLQRADDVNMIWKQPEEADTSLISANRGYIVPIAVIVSPMDVPVTRSVPVEKKSE
jgi:hypothetical protein